MNARSALLVTAIGTLLTVRPIVAQLPATPRQPPIEVPRPIPTAVSWNLNRGTVDWAKLRGKVVLVDFWNFR